MKIQILGSRVENKMLIFSFENGLKDVCAILPNVLGRLCMKIDEGLGHYIGGSRIDCQIRLKQARFFVS